MPSARAKKLDQLYVSKAEIKKNKQIKALKGAVAYAQWAFKDECDESFTSQFWNRLVKTAKRRKMTPLQYAEKVLLK